MSVDDAQIEVGDLIWNVRGEGGPGDFEQAVAELQRGNYFKSHVDIVVSIEAASCDSIGGNVSNFEVGGSVTRSTWKLAGGKIADQRKLWLGVVRIGI